MPTHAYSKADGVLSGGDAYLHYNLYAPTRPATKVTELSPVAIAPPDEDGINFSAASIVTLT
ncbi:MAG: hypothetical protein IJ467_05740 [Bacteroidaceae bacterium]|nr:hypothetical protein [Bacteroidaceae bacterium]